MRLLVAALAEHGSISQPGDKLNVNGVFDTVTATAFPTVLPIATLALRIEFDHDDREKKHGLQVVMVNQDGKEFAKIEGELVTPYIAPGNRMTANQIIVLQQLVFKSADRFSILIRWNGVEQQRLRLDVVAIQAPPKAT